MNDYLFSAKTENSPKYIDVTICREGVNLMIRSPFSSDQDISFSVSELMLLADNLKESARHMKEGWPDLYGDGDERI